MKRTLDLTSVARLADILQKDSGLLQLNSQFVRMMKKSRTKYRRSRVLVYLSGEMEKPSTPRPLYYSDHQANNQIGDLGCQYLSNAAWSSLEQLRIGIFNEKICANRISEKGCQHLSNQHLDNVKALYLGSNEAEGGEILFFGKGYLEKH